MTADAPLPSGASVDFDQPAQIMAGSARRVGAWLCYKALYRGSPIWLDEYFPLRVVERAADGTARPISPEANAAWQTCALRNAALAEGLERVVQASAAARSAQVVRPPVLQPLVDGRVATDGADGRLVTLSAFTPDGRLLLGGLDAPEQISIADHLAAGRTFSVAGIHALAAQLADALIRIHGEDLLHGDLRPETVLLAGDRVLLAHFAIDQRDYMKVLGDKSTLVYPPYSAVELYNAGASESISPSTDIYAASALLYELAAGRKAPDWQDRLKNPGLSALPKAKGLSDSFCRAIERGLAVAVAQAFNTVEEWRDAMALGDAAHHPAGWFATSGGRGWVVAVVAAVALVLLAAVGFLGVKYYIDQQPLPVQDNGNEVVAPPRETRPAAAPPADNATDPGAGPIENVATSAPIVEPTVTSTSSPTPSPTQPPPPPVPKVADLEGSWHLRGSHACDRRIDVDGNGGGFTVRIVDKVPLPPFHHSLGKWTSSGWQTSLSQRGRLIGNYVVTPLSKDQLSMAAENGKTDIWVRCD